MKNTYESPFNSRYASEQMQAIFSPDTKFRTWLKILSLPKLKWVVFRTELWYNLAMF